MAVYPLAAAALAVGPAPLCEVHNPCPQYCLINSVDFHPAAALFCVACTHGNRIAIYRYGDDGAVALQQELSNPAARLCEPQHAAFSADGELLAVANWSDVTINVYRRTSDGAYSASPSAVVACPPSLTRHKPHGIAFSPDGRLFAVAYGASSHYGRAVALYRVSGAGAALALCHVLEEPQLPGIPKGIAFAPDSDAVLVTFSDDDSVAVFGLDQALQCLAATPHQLLKGVRTGLSRPEDVKVTADGRHIAVSNSGCDTVTFYRYDRRRHRIREGRPSAVLRNPVAQLHFPHGLAFSYDGRLLAVTLFGPVKVTDDGGIAWSRKTAPRQAKVLLYRVH